MLYLIALGECVIAAGVAIEQALPLNRTGSERYGAMISITVLTFSLAVSAFVASDTAKLEHHGGVHALRRSRVAR